MRVLLILGFIALFIYFGYYVMTKLDKFLAEKGFAAEKDEIRPAAVIMGETALAKEIGGLLERDGIRVLRITEPFLIEQGQNLRYLFALSENDADNIVLYKIGFKVYGMEKMISLCNDSRNEGIFIREGIRCLLREKATAGLLYQAVMRKKEEVGEKQEKDEKREKRMKP